MKNSILNATVLLLLCSVAAQAQRAYRAPWLKDELKRQSGTYTNPILDGNYADPWMLEYNNMYYLMPTMPDGSVSVFVSKTLDRFDSPPIQLFMPPNLPVWAPELHIIDGEFYVYCTLPDGPDDADHRMHVLKGTDANDPTKPFEDLGVVGTPDENYAIDGTVLINYLNHEGVLANYFIWSGKESRDTGTVQYLYIAQLSTPSTLIGERTMIHSPYWPDGSRKDWQWSPNDYGVNEGPEILVNGDKTFLIYSACGSWDPCYSLGLMSLNSTGLNPLDPNAWYAKDDGPVFTKSDVTVGTGHASFPYDANDTPYIVYHAWPVNAEGGWGARKVMTQAFSFDANGDPVFPVPVAEGVELPAAAGY